MPRGDPLNYGSDLLFHIAINHICATAILPWTASMTAPVVPRHAAKSPTPLFQLKLASLQTDPHPARIHRRAFGGVLHQNG